MVHANPVAAVERKMPPPPPPYQPHRARPVGAILYLYLLLVEIYEKILRTLHLKSTQVRRAEQRA